MIGGGKLENNRSEFEWLSSKRNCSEPKRLSPCPVATTTSELLIRDPSQ